jgi:hypothetical protein
MLRPRLFSTLIPALLAALLLNAPARLASQDSSLYPGLRGRVEGRVYSSPTGVFQVAIPVLPELGGRVSDTENVVTFEDAFNTHVSIAAFQHDASQRWELSTRGLQDYLIFFFTNFVMADFGQVFRGVRNESAKFGPLAGLPDGALIAYLLIPGGTMFAQKVPTVRADGSVPVAKRGNLLFVKNGHTFVISIELAERVIEGKSYSKTTAEDDEILLQRLEAVVQKMQFAKPPSIANLPAPTK